LCGECEWDLYGFSQQGKAVVTFLDKILDMTPHSDVVALLAARGRGKSAALGLSIAGAIAAG
jgi:N-acetyltransferase 10